MSTAPSDSVAKDIIGVFEREEWIDDVATPLDSEEFVATEYVLGLSLEAIHAIRDGRESSDQVGLAHVLYDGPFTVRIVEAIQEFFGVESVADVTEEMLQAAKAEFATRPLKRFSIEVTRTTKVTLRILVDSVNVSAAQRKALALAPERTFPSASDAEYAIGDVTEVLE